jgi:hypothetical protein
MTEDTPGTGAGSDRGGTAERLWFDYLSKLNDRELQTARASGATSWLLLAVVAAIAYRGLSGLNRFVSAPHALATAGTVGALLGDSLLHFLLAFFGLVYYSVGKFEARLVPSLTSRARGVLVYTFAAAWLAFAGAHFLLSGSAAPAVPRTALIAFGLLCLANGVYGLLSRLYQWRRAKGLGIPFVELRGLPVSPTFGGLGLGVFGLAIGGVASACLYKDLVRLGSLSVDYVGYLSIASQFWVSAILLFVLFNRLLASLSRGVYLELERDVVLKHLSVQEIQQRFTEEALGKPVANWLNELRAQLNVARSRFRDIASRITVELDEVEKIDRSYSLERQGRALEIANNYAAELKDLAQKERAVAERVKQFEKVFVSVKPSYELESAIKDWANDVNHGVAEIGAVIASFERRICAICDEPTDRDAA